MRTIVKFHTTDNVVASATSTTDALIGVTIEASYHAGYRVRVQMSGIAQVVLGGTVTRGDWLTTSSGGRAVKANPTGTAEASVIGRALGSGTSSKVIEVLLAPGEIKA